MQKLFAGISGSHKSHQINLPEGDEHGDTAYPVADSGPHHCSRQLKGGVFQLFRHVRTSIWSYETPDGSSQTNQTRQFHVTPGSAVTTCCQSRTPSGRISCTYLKLVKTCDAGAWSAIIHNVSRKAKNAKMCRKSTAPSASGKWRAKKMLKHTVKITNAKMMSVVCQRPVMFASG